MAEASEGLKAKDKVEETIAALEEAQRLVQEVRGLEVRYPMGFGHARDDEFHQGDHTIRSLLQASNIIPKEGDDFYSDDRRDEAVFKGELLTAILGANAELLDQTPNQLKSNYQRGNGVYNISKSRSEKQSGLELWIATAVNPGITFHLLLDETSEHRYREGPIKIIDPPTDVADFKITQELLFSRLPEQKTPVPAISI